MAARLVRAVRAHDTLALLAVVIAAIWVVGLVAGATLERQVVLGLMNLIAVVGLWIFSGTSGVLSFGHVAFMAIGAYTAGILSIPADEKALLLPDLPGALAETTLDPLLATIAGGVVAGVFALVLCGPLLRLAGIAASLTTLAILAIVYVVAANWQAVTGGTSGIGGVPERTTLGAAALWALVAIAIAYAVGRSRWGRRLRASRDDDVAARSLGIGVTGERRIAFVLSGFVVGTAGGLYGQFLGSFVPGTFYFDITFVLMAMLVVGGIATLSGAVVGAIAITCATELLRRIERGVDIGPLQTGSVTGLTELGLALVMLVVLIWRPAGLMGGRELTWPRRARRSLAGPAPADLVPVPDREGVRP
jgi:branched-chain amino acid transport system permease protein